jgi:alkylation response protein AidB-like acyl-CoA dehydrogenase
LNLLIHDNAGRDDRQMELLTKLGRTRFVQQASTFAVDTLGAAGIVDYDYAFEVVANHDIFSWDKGLRHHFLWSRAATIGGGTSEVLKNSIGERLLGLPREPRPDSAPSPSVSQRVPR